jgi:hypothetical protein
MKHIKSLLLVTLLGASFTSCNDFLNLDPLNDIVLENFWTDKSDVESAVLGIYEALEQGDCVKRMAIWGEIRSDNYIEGNQTSEDIRQLLRENLIYTNSYCKYLAFYNVINRANTVLHYAPEVADKDPNYLYDELLAHEAEAVTLRCLSYWYLIRTFHDVPYVLEPSIDNEGGKDKFYVPQSTFEEILDTLIKDLEYYKRYAVNKYPSEAANTARITKSSICALLADMYLWRGRADDWDKCIAVCEEVNALKRADYEKIKGKQGQLSDLKLFNGYPLISESWDEDELGNAFYEIFGSGNSFESLFELPYSYDVKNPANGFFINRQFGTNFGELKISNRLGDGFSGSGNEVFEQPLDNRYYHNVLQLTSDATSYAPGKFITSDLEVFISGGSIELEGQSVRGENGAQANWMMYRYTEVLLFEAEAYIAKAKIAGEGSGDADTYKTKAFNLIDAVNKRAIGYDNEKIAKTSPKTLKTMGIDETATPDQLLELLLKERRREFISEGKRWYDLVRIARREGNPDRLLRAIGSRHDGAIFQAIKIKLKNPYYMYFPLAKDELRNSNGYLKQNPAYKDDEKVEQASH